MYDLFNEIMGNFINTFIIHGKLTPSYVQLKNYETDEHEIVLPVLLIKTKTISCSQLVKNTLKSTKEYIHHQILA